MWDWVYWSNLPQAFCLNYGHTTKGVTPMDNNCLNVVSMNLGGLTTYG
jgi:hypothetical protein